jgi:hypothetical protein
VPIGQNFQPIIIDAEFQDRFTRALSVRGSTGDFLTVGTQVTPTIDVGRFLSGNVFAPDSNPIIGGVGSSIIEIGPSDANITRTTDPATRQYCDRVNEVEDGAPLVINTNYTFTGTGLVLPPFTGMAVHLDEGRGNFPGGLYNVIVRFANNGNDQIEPNFGLVFGKFQDVGNKNGYVTVSERRFVGAARGEEPSGVVAAIQSVEYRCVVNMPPNEIDTVVVETLRGYTAAQVTGGSFRVSMSRLLATPLQFPLA